MTCCYVAFQTKTTETIKNRNKQKNVRKDLDISCFSQENLIYFSLRGEAIPENSLFKTHCSIYKINKKLLVTTPVSMLIFWRNKREKTTYKRQNTIFTSSISNWVEEITHRVFKCRRQFTILVLHASFSWVSRFLTNEVTGGKLLDDVLFVSAMQPLVAGLQCYMCTYCTTPTGLQTVANGASGYSCTVSTNKFCCIWMSKLICFCIIHCRNIQWW